MLRNYFLLNLLLILIIGVLGFKLYNIVDSTAAIPSEAQPGSTQTVDVDVRQAEKSINEGVFDTISRLDLFRPSRSAPVAGEKRTDTAAPMKNPPKLFGTIILNNNQTAILEDPDSKTTKSYKLHDSIAGYEISEIHENKVVLIRDGDKVEVKLRDEKGVSPSPRSPGIQPAISQNQIQPGAAVQTQTPTRTRPIPPRRRPARVRPPTGTTPAPAPAVPGEPGGAVEQ